MRLPNPEGFLASNHRTSVRRGSVVLDVSADVDYERLAEALLVLRRYLELPSATSLDQTLLDRSRANLASAHNLSYATTEQVARTLFEAWENDWPLASADRIPGQLLAATLADVLATSEHCRNNWVLSLLGDETRLRAAWSGALAKPLSAWGTSDAFGTNGGSKAVDMGVAPSSDASTKAAATR